MRQFYHRELSLVMTFSRRQMAGDCSIAIPNRIFINKFVISGIFHGENLFLVRIIFRYGPNNLEDLVKGNWSITNT